MKMVSGIQCYVCEDDCDSDANQLQICDNAIMCWKMATLDSNGVKRSRRGCIKNKIHQTMYCNTRTNVNLRNRTGRKISGFYNTECCMENLCNSGSYPYLPDPDIPDRIFTDKFTINSSLAIIIGLTVIGLIMIATAIYSLFSCCCKKRQSQSLSDDCKKNYLKSDSPPPFSDHVTELSDKELPQEIRISTPGDSTIKEFLGSLSSGSGAGRPFLIQQTLGRQVDLIECLTKRVSKTSREKEGGSFGREIWRGIRMWENVAVKIYYSRNESIWAQEIEIYSKLMISRHENILGIVGCDVLSRCDCTQMWIVTDYCSQGSLYEYLNEHLRLDYSQMFNICLSIVNGLLYLHTEILGSTGDVKPVVAHRNLNSKTIFVKANGTCVIGDLSYAVTQDKLTNGRTNLSAKRFRQASKLYMAPELLDDKFDSKRLEEFCCTDVYSLGIILWEVCRQCSSKDIVFDYALPYSDILGSNPQPTFEEMLKLVVTDECRPTIPTHWCLEPTLLEMEATIKECWYPRAAARLPILRVKKSLVNHASKKSGMQLLMDLN